MDIKDILNRLNNISYSSPISTIPDLNEAILKPGERKSISFKMNRVEKMQDELAKYERLTYNINANPPKSLAKELMDLQNTINQKQAVLSKTLADLRDQAKDANGTPVKLSNFFKGIEKHCRQILKVYQNMNTDTSKTGSFLYRGVKYTATDAIYGKPHEKRIPKDSKSYPNEWFNKKLLDAGFAANRENALFVTGKLPQAESYASSGSTYIVFPTDGFQFTQSKRYGDLILDYEMIGGCIFESHQNRLAEIRQMIKDVKEKADAELNTDLINKLPTDYSISKLFTSRPSIKLDIDTVKNLVEKDILPKEIAVELDKMPTDEEFINYFRITDKDLYAAIQSNKELCVKTEAYYAINNKYETEIKDFLQKLNLDDVDLPDWVGEYVKPIEEGSIVKITVDGPYKDKVGVVNIQYDSGTYNVAFSKSSDMMCDRDDMELIQQPGKLPEDVEYVVTNTNSIYYGLTGMLTYQSFNGKDVELENSSGKALLIKTEVSPVSEYPELKNNAQYIGEGSTVEISDPSLLTFGEIGDVDYVVSRGNTLLVRIGNSTSRYRRNQLTKVDVNKLIDTEKDYDYQFNIGDTVLTSSTSTNLPSKWTSKVCKIVSRGIDKEGNECYVVIGTAAPINKIEKVVLASDISLFKTHKIGDKVIVNTPSYSKPMAAEVVEIATNGDYIVKLKDNGAMMRVAATSVSTGELPTDNSSEYKVGDVVTITGPSFYGTEDFIGKHAIIKSIGLHQGNPMYDITVLDRNGEETHQDLWYSSKNFQGDMPTSNDTKPDYASQSSTSEYNRGDKVKIIGKSIYGNTANIGKIGTVSKMDTTIDGQPVVSVEVPDTDLFKYVYTLGNIEKYDESMHVPETTLKVGNLVKSKTGALHPGKVGKIVDVDLTSTYPYKVRIEGIGDVPYSLDEVELTDAFPLKLEDFKPGDRVKVNGKHLVYNGELGTVVVNHSDYHPLNEMVAVKLDNTITLNSTKWFKPESLLKVNDTVADEPVKLHTTDIQVGDTVLINNPALGANGKLAYVTAIDLPTPEDNSIVMSVKFPDGKEGILHHYELLKVDNPQQLQVGDKVQLNNPKNAYYGKVGKIIKLEYDKQFKKLCATVDFPEYYKKPDIFTYALEKVADNTSFSTAHRGTTDNFKKGDRIKVKANYLQAHGKLGTVIGVSRSMVKVTLDDTNSIYPSFNFHPHELEKIS